MKTRITAALALLTELHQVGHIRDEGNPKFQAAKQELEAALAMPEPEPITVNSPEVDTLNATLTSIGVDVNNVADQLISVATKLAEVDTKVTALQPAPAG